MSLSSQKSISNTEIKVKTPTRRRGRERVAQLLEAGAAVFAERGFDGATMTEIAARAGASIGSLYQFFPNKDLLADALVARYGAHVFERLDEIERQAAKLDTADLNAALFTVFRHLADERELALSLLDARWREPRARPGHFRSHIREQLARILRLWNPELSEADASIHSAVIHHAMKADMQLAGEPAFSQKVEVETAWRDLLLSYLSGLK